MKRFANYFWIFVAISWASQIQEESGLLKLLYILCCWLAIVNFIEGEKEIKKGETK